MIMKTGVVAFDTETELICYENPVPDLICMTYSTAGTMTGSIKTPWEHDIRQQFIDAIESGQHLVGHNVAFDISILVFKYPDLLPYFLKALENGQVHDTLLREKLLMLTLYGNFEMIENNGCIQRLGYKLVDLEKKYLNLDRSDLKNDADAPRTNYAMYKNVPLNKWPSPFISYAIDDAVNTGLIYEAQEKAREHCIEITANDPFNVETFRVKISVALRLLECAGSRLDPEEVEKVSEQFTTSYNQPRLRNPLLEAGLLVKAVPEMPYAKGTKEHASFCIGHKDHPDYNKSKKVKDCTCPLKMKKGKKETNPTKPLFKYIWNLAYHNPNIQAWPSDSCVSSLKKSGLYNDVINEKAFTSAVIKSSVDKNNKAILPGDVKLKTDAEWSSSFSHLDPLLSIWAERRALRKIITDYLPKMYVNHEDGTKTPAEIIRGSFYPLCLTGRSSSSASKLYPSRNEQNVDPRVRPCTIPRENNIIVSTDYSGMELGTLAQKCINLFGSSVLGDKINAGIDTHAYLAAQIAVTLDSYFASLLLDVPINPTDTDAVYGAFAALKECKETCDSTVFCDSFKAKYRQEKNKDLNRPVLWSDFFKYYRLLAKPTGLGFPGGLGAKTMIAYAKGTYKIDLSLSLAQSLRDVWLKTYPEMEMYLNWIKKSCKDPFHAPIEIEQDDGTVKTKTFFSYDTPKGMHRARCGFCEAANGAALQAFAAEGALEGLYRVVKAMWTAEPADVLYGTIPINFIHDEILWESPEDSKVGDRVRLVEKLMVDAMEELTPNVKAGAESVAMRRWYKYAEAIWDGNKNLIAWEPPLEKKGI